MAKKAIHKVFGHLVLYIIIILGIFALQFRNQSIISRNFGQLRLSLSEITDESGNKQFKDSFFISYKGISIFSNTETPIIVTDTKKRQKALVFTGWKEISDSAFELHFSGDLILLCGLTGKNKETLTLSVPQTASFQSFAIPYQFSDSYSLMDLTQKRAILSGKTQQNALSASLIENSYVILTPAENTLTYANYEPSKEFLFEWTSSYELAQKSYYDTAVNTIKNTLISQFSSSPEALSEQAVVSYITEMAVRGKYPEAVASIPDVFINGTRRTYLSAPFLNNLAAMSKSLKMQQDNLIYKLNYALEKQSLDIFKAESLYSFLGTQRSDTVKKLLDMPSTLPVFEPAVSEAAGILNTYNGLVQKKNAAASSLLPLLGSCLDVIRKSCFLENDALFLIEKEEKLPALLTIQIAQTLIEHGLLVSNNDVVSAGYMLFSSQVQSINQTDIRFIADIYAVIEKNNSYYPHIEVINTSQNTPMWAWTSAKSISTSTDEDGTITLQTSFPAGYTHYMIVHNVEPFKSIEIYDMMFRTDARFESYNSSGYVYDASSKTLFLKYRHKTYTEKVRLFYKEQDTQTDTADSNVQPQSQNSADKESGQTPAESSNEQTSAPAVTSPVQSTVNNETPSQYVPNQYW